jgi:hypothetical protein
MGKREEEGLDASRLRADSAVMDHDPEDAVREGMSTDAAGVDSSETEASAGNAESAFVEIAAGAATGRGIDRGEAIGADGFVAAEDRRSDDGGSNGRRRSR